MISDIVPKMKSRSSLGFLKRILAPLANGLYTHHSMVRHRSWRVTFLFSPKSVYTNICNTTHEASRIHKFVYTSTGILMLLLVMSCSTPSQSIQEEGISHLEQTSQEHEKSQLDDTTTITHKRIDSTATVTQIIRKIIYDKDQSARSLQDSTYQNSRRVEDSLTPALISTISKGFAAACIGLGLMVLGFLIIVVILIFRLSRNT